MSKLAEICAAKRDHIAAQKSKVALESLKHRIHDSAPPRGFIAALRAAQGPTLIAEVKKASPSKGIIRADFNPAQIAEIYAQNGASCLSVLTDTPYFQGTDSDFAAVRLAVSLPLLRKDFILDPYQIYETRALGADCVLLIMAALTDDEARALYDLTRALGMDALLEIHDQAELDRALRLNPAMTGVNNRSLKTLAVDLATSFSLAPLIPASCLAVAESGITDHETLISLQKAGFSAFLVGEGLMRAADIGAATRALLKGH